MSKSGLREEGVKLVKSESRGKMSHPSGGESIHAGETFNSLDMEANYPQQSIKYSVRLSHPPSVWYGLIKDLTGLTWRPLSTCAVTGWILKSSACDWTALNCKGQLGASEMSSSCIAVWSL